MKKMISFILVLVLLSTTSFAFTGSTAPISNPDKNITVAEFTKLVTVTITQMDLGNAKTGNWYDGYVSLAKSLGIIKDGEFSSKDFTREITREEVSRMTVRGLAKKPLNGNTSFKDDNQISSSMKGYVKRAIELELINGYSNGTFNPKGRISRNEALNVISKMIKNIDDYKKLLTELLEQKTIKPKKSTPTKIDPTIDPSLKSEKEDFINKKLTEEKKSYKDVTEFKRELLTKYISENQGDFEYIVKQNDREREYGRVKYVYKIDVSDLPIKINDYVLYSIEPEIEIVGSGKNPTFVVHQTINEIGDGLYMHIADKNFNTVRRRNNYVDWTPENPTIDKYGNKIYKTYYGVIVMDRLPDWKTYRGKDAYHLIFNDYKNNFAVIVENAFNKQN